MRLHISFFSVHTHILFGMPAGGGAMGGGYRHTIVTTSSPSNSRDGWNLITMLLVKTLCGSYITLYQQENVWLEKITMLFSRNNLYDNLPHIPVLYRIP